MSRGDFAGVDLHKSVIQVCVLNGRGVVILEQRFAGTLGSLGGTTPAQIPFMSS